MADRSLTDEHQHSTLPSAAGSFLSSAGMTLGILASATVLVGYVAVRSALPWLPWSGVAGRCVGMGLSAAAMVAAAVRCSDRPVIATGQFKGWRGWTFALGLVPAAALVVDVGITALVRSVFDVGPSGTYNDLPSSAPVSDRWLMWLLAVVGAVIVEELLYRGAILSVALAAKPLPAVAILASSVPWALTHGGVTGGYNAAEVAGIVAAGVVTGWACFATRSLIPGLAAHATLNLIASASLVRPWTLVVGVAAGVAVIVLLVTFTVLLAVDRRRWARATASSLTSTATPPSTRRST